MSKFHACLHGRLFKLIIPLFILFSPIAGSAETDVEKDVNEDLNQSVSLTLTIQEKLKTGATISEEIKKLKGIAEEITASHMLLEERFNKREEKLKRTKAIERHRAMKEGYQKALREYLNLVETLPRDNAPSLPLFSKEGDGGSSPSEIADKLKTLLNKIVVKKKRPIIGSLPYKNLNYPAKEPSSAPAITPAYRGGNKTVAPEDTQGTEEAPISPEIAAIAQNLNWKPVDIYEYVKNSIETEWYYGCMKGAEETLRQKSGNDCDQAALLTALLRASGFPTRYVRGTMQFFATDGKPIERIKNLIGVQDPYKKAEFFRKAGIPFKPIIQGGGITNIQIEHIWVESQIPYANYRGAVIDEHGKTWLGLDTSIKVKDYVYNSPEDVFSGQWPVVSGQFTGLRDEYLTTNAPSLPLFSKEGDGGSLIPTPLEYLKTQFTANGLQYTDFLRTRTLPEEHLKILPSSMQIEPVKITNEYIEIPDELKHKVKITAADTNKNELFTITLPTQKLSNQKIAISYEPETVEDQEIIDSYGGLDNTPAYLVRLRPVLKINGERMAVAKDGLHMGADYSLTIELISPNGTEKTSSSQITGNLSVIGIVAGKALSTKDTKEHEETAEGLLYNEAINYIDRWNQAEEEIASLLHLAYSRPLPTVVTVGGVIDVTYLLDMPHGFEWKGAFIDAGLRRIETTTSIPSPLAGEGQGEGDRKKLFMQLSALQGSVLENRIFEDDFKVESISTAKLFQLSNSTNTQLITIDKTNINTVLPTLSLDEAIKEDIINSVNQNLTILIPQSEIAYQDWTGIGYIKENLQTGEAGYMLSGMIAGGMNAIDKLKWYNQDIVQALSAPYTEAPNTTPSDAVEIKRITAGDYQSDTAGDKLSDPLQVLARDKDGNAVKGVAVTFTTISGGGELSGTDENGWTVTGTKITVKTGWNGVANAYLTLGQHTDDSPYYANGDPYLTLVGQNLISASAEPGTGTIYTDKPFEAYGYPGDAVKIVKTYGYSEEENDRYYYGLPNTLSSAIVLQVTDQYDNPISNKKVTFKVEPQTFQFFNTSIPAPTGTTKNAKIFKNTADCPGVATLDCSNAVSELSDIYTDSSGALAYVILGNTDNTKYSIKATTQGVAAAYFNHYISSVKKSEIMSSPKLSLISLAILKNAAPPGALIEEPLIAVMRVTKEDYEAQTVNCGENCYYIKGKGTFTTTPVNKGEVAFNINTGGGSVTPETVKYTETEITEGKYQTYLTLGSTPAQNKVYATGTAIVGIPIANQTTGLIEARDTLLDAGRTTFKITGVKATIEPNPFIIVDDGGHLLVDTPIKYKIEPETPTPYTPQDIFVDIYEEDSTGMKRWFGFVAADGSGNLVLTDRTAKFDINKTYYAELVLNRGSVSEIRSEKVELPVAEVMVKDNQEFKVVDEVKYGDGSNLKKKYHVEVKLKAKKVKCSDLSGDIRVIDSKGQTIKTVGTEGAYSLTEHQIKLSYSSLTDSCKSDITDATDGEEKESFIVSNSSKAELNGGLFDTNLYSTAVLYGGIGNIFQIELNAVKVEVPVEPVGVVVIGIDGLRQDALYQGATYDSGQDDCGGQSCYMEPAKLSGLCEVLGGKYNDGWFSNTCDYANWEQRHTKLKTNVIFPSITLASWASIFSGKQSGETGMMGNEFFARDLYNPNTTNNIAIPGMSGLPSGVITLSSGAFKNDSANFMGNNLVPSDTIIEGMEEGGLRDVLEEAANQLLSPTQRTLQDKFDDSAPNQALKAESIYEWINNQAGINNKYNEETVKDDLSKSCLTNGKECRSVVIANHYSKGTDYWGTVSSPIAAALTKTFNGESYLLDSLAAEGAKTFLDEYTGKRFPALMTIYFAGLDHEAHGEKNLFGQEVGGMDEYKSFFKDVADKKILEVVEKLKEKGQFDNKIFIVTADHGHTGMAAPIYYKDPKDGQQREADTSCSLNIEGFDRDKVKNKEKYNNNLHIWELANLFQQFGNAEGLKLLVPKEIEQAIVGELQNDEVPAVTSIIDQANVIAALNGPMAHVYVKGASGWGTANGDAVMLGRVADKLYKVLVEGINKLTDNQKEKFPRLLSSLDKILIRTDNLYKIYKGVTKDAQNNITGLVEPGALTELNDPDYVEAANRITKMNNLNRSGDIVLLMRSGSGDPPDDRYSSGVSCKSWHGSLNKTDSYVPLIVSYPGGNKFEIDPMTSSVCSGGQCEGNWQLSDIVKKIIETQYSGQ